MANDQARDARDSGIATAALHADRISPDWRERALAALKEYAAHHPTFTIEQLRQSLNGQLEDPPSLRAWGAVAKRAAYEGVLEHFGWCEAEDPKVHCNVVRVWRSLVSAALPRPPMERTMDAEMKARELLIGEYREAGLRAAAYSLEAGEIDWPEQCALRAIRRALEQPASAAGDTAQVQMLREEITMLRGLLEDAFADLNPERSACSDGCCGGCNFERIEVPAVKS